MVTYDRPYRFCRTEVAPDLDTPPTTAHAITVPFESPPQKFLNPGLTQSFLKYHSQSGFEWEGEHLSTHI